MAVIVSISLGKQYEKVLKGKTLEK